MTKRKTKKVSQNNTVSEKTASAATKPSATNKRLSKTLYILLLFPLFLALMIGGILLNYNLIVKNPEISVVMPVYNTAKYLPESISGVLDQTFKDFELIMVNDGSTDNSLEIMQEYAKKDKRIKVVNMDKNSGAAAARNEGIKYITGEYTLFVDSDDFMLPVMLEKMYNQAKLYNLDIVMSLAWAVDEPSGDLFPISIIDRKVSFAYHFLQKQHINYFSYKQFPKIFFQLMRKYVWDKLIKTSVIKDNNLYFDNVQSHNDSYFITMALLHAKRIGYITDRVYLYRANRSGSVSGKNPDDMKSSYDTFIKIRQSLQDMGIYNELYESFMKWVGSFIPPEDWPLQTQEDYIYRQKLIELRYNSDDI
ncbi:MAG: glycosyltransferase [Alphaproteobacteria bacterium]|nr:glycosyltransferase [Alphaproteobacteria bacterium]